MFLVDHFGLAGEDTQVQPAFCSNSSQRRLVDAMTIARLSPLPPERNRAAWWLLGGSVRLRK